MSPPTGLFRVNVTCRYDTLWPLLTTKDIVILKFNVEKKGEASGRWIQPLGILNAFRSSLHQEHGGEPSISYSSTAMGFLGVLDCLSLQFS